MAESRGGPRTLWVDGVDSLWPVAFAETAASRALGLLLREQSAVAAVLVLRPCCAVHTFGMRRAIDVMFTDASSRVLRVEAALLPWRVAFEPGARAVWEAPAGLARTLGIAPGAVLEAQGS